MGADGGVNWIRLKDKSQRPLFNKLVGPLGLLFEKGSTHEANRSYLYNNPHSEDKVISTYGTNQRRYGMEELIDIVRYLQSLKEEHDWFWNAGDPLELTWEEVLADCKTNPNFIIKYSPYIGRHYEGWTPPIARLMYEEYDVWFDQQTFTITDTDKFISKEAYEVLRTPLKKWLEQIEPLIIMHSLGSEETWT